MRWRILGPVEVVVPGRVLLDRRPQQRGLLAYLLLNANRLVAIEQLVEAIWGTDPPRTARTQVHANVSRIRRALRCHGADRALISSAGSYRIAVEDGELDLAEFVRQVEQARAAVGVGDLPVAARLLRAGLDLWRGEPFTGASGAYIEAASVRLQEQRLLAWEELADLELALGRHARITDELRALVGANPLRERLVGQLMLALAASGQQAQALSWYAETRGRLADELGVEPGPELAEVYLRVLRQQVPVTAPRTSSVRSAPAATGPAQVTPAQLPADLPRFAGRTAALHQLSSLLSAEARRRPRVVALTGTAGVGKTALMVYWAHQIAERFPDGQLYVDLRGFHPDRRPLKPAGALRGFLNALGVPRQEMPADLHARAALYRSLLAGRRVLIAMDNARDPDQVQALLPGTGGCLALITSRHQLTSLVATRAVHPLTLDLPSQDEARQLLAARIGRERTGAEPEAVDQIITACARLPLALAVVAARAATRPSFPLRSLAEELATVQTSLDALTSPDRLADVRAAFASSYRALSPATARLFRQLAIHPATDITLPAAARLTGLPPSQVRPLLAELAEGNVLTEHLPGRYSCHHLLRAYAAELRRLEPDTVPSQGHGALGEPLTLPAWR